MRLTEIKNLPMPEIEGDIHAQELFINLYNTRALEPAIMSVSSPIDREEIFQFENEPGISVVPAETEFGMLNTLRKMMERFQPMSRKAEPDYYSRMLLEYAKSKGINITRNENRSIEEDILDSLKSHGTVGYFPRGITKHGSIELVKIRYFDEAFAREIMQASEWLLSPEESQEVYRNSTVVSIGQSVGSELVTMAFQRGITKFVLADPGTFHNDQMGRIRTIFDPEIMGLNKSLYLRQYLLKRFPYADVQSFPDGITAQNYQEIINENRLAASQRANGGQLLILEEADAWSAKKLTRQAMYAMSSDTPCHLFMFGDVAHRVTFSHEEMSTIPFLGKVASADPNGDVYGAGLVAQNEMLALFASVGGFEGLPIKLLMMLKNGEIGIDPKTKIAIVPQSGEATALASAMFGEVLRLLPTPAQIVRNAVVDLESSLNANWDQNDKEKMEEIALQRELSLIYFKKETL